ncbi:MAG: bifunctional transaldolase/phosoglucose isomerase [Terriglobales bacterium]
MPNPLQQLHDFGQSFWYDNIRRALLTSGELKRMVEEDGLRGLTSNPTIFEKAIAGSGDYDASIRRNLHLPPRDLFLELAIEDIAAACDVLRGVYDGSGGADGFCSIEVTPDLAHDEAATIAQARELWRRTARPNVMVKVPATPECIPAIHKLLAEGININITLLFDYESYGQVVEAWLSALEKRLHAGQPVNRLASVASLFVSRVDTKVDAMLAAKAKADPARAASLEALEGKAGIANARRMYAYFKQIVASPRFQKLAAAGAHPQRLLWASTSTKNPRYPDTLYADALIGPDTVDTMPDATIHAFRDHGHPADRLSGSLAEAGPVLEGLRAASIDFEAALRELQVEGVEKFAESYDELTECIRAKARVLAGGGTDGMQIARPAGLAPPRAALDQIEKRKVVTDVWRKDPSAWTSDSSVGAKITNRLGWLPLPEMMLEQAPVLDAFVATCLGAGFRHAVLLGMGGSSLAPEVFRQIFGVAAGKLELTVLDTTDPVTIARVDATLNYAEALFIVSSKSGGTIEPNSLFAYFWDRATRQLNGASARNVGGHFIAITDEGTSLQHLAEQHHFRHVFVNPADIGGRYSALSYFGLVPAALVGVDLATLLKRAQVMAQACATCVPGEQNPAVQLGAAIGTWAEEGRDKLTLVAPPELAPLGAWLEQLIAESTGKLGKGIVPIDGEPPAAPEHYGQDRVFVRLQLADGSGAIQATAAGDDWVEAQLAAGAPVITINLRDRYDLGQEFLRWEFAVALAGSVLGINPFDEPNVQESKDNTNRVIERFAAGGARAAGIEADPRAREGALAAYGPGPQREGIGVEGELASLLFSVHAGDYFALMAYLEREPETEKALQRVRLLLRDRLKVATTLGFGPRFLHSTGQLHKGGANSGVFLQLTAFGHVMNPQADRAIPGRPFSFGTLMAAQAVGDYQSLVAHDRRVMRLDLGADPEAGLKRLLELAHMVLTGAEAARQS